jgi:molybdopterin-synthase adenylyltransferase
MPYPNTGAGHIYKRLIMNDYSMQSIQDDRSDRSDRYARHHLIPGFSQALVSSLSIGVVGAGAIGNEVIKNLLLMGVGSIDLYDFDTVELSNLTRSVFLRESDIGINKAQAVVNRAEELHPATRMQAFAGPIDRKLSLTQFSQYDMVVAAVDNLEARLRINDMALLTNTPWINTAIDSHNVVVELFPSGGNKTDHPIACYACSLPDSAFERIARRYSCGGLQRAAQLTRTVPTTSITASSAGALACSELLRYLHATYPKMPSSKLFGDYKTDVAQRIFFDTAAPSVSRTLLPSAPEERGCPGCGLHQASELRDVIELETTRNVRLSDAIIIDCHCTQCGATTENTPTLKALRGRRAREYTDAILRCPQCLEDTISIDMRETLNADEFAQLYAKQPPDCAWLIQGQNCFDLLPRNL